MQLQCSQIPLYQRAQVIVPPFCQSGIPILLHNVHRLFRSSAKRINLKNLLSAFELPLQPHFGQSVARILPIAEAAFVHAIQKIPCPCSYPVREIEPSIKNARSLYRKSYCIFVFFAKSIHILCQFMHSLLNGSFPANLRLHLRKLRCSLFSGLHFCRFRGIFLIYAV